jgi:hypothetical protein
MPELSVDLSASSPHPEGATRELWSREPISVEYDRVEFPLEGGAIFEPLPEINVE